VNRGFLIALYIYSVNINENGKAITDQTHSPPPSYCKFGVSFKINKEKGVEMILSKP
jgi:hypothetical protein